MIISRVSACWLAARFGAIADCEAAHGQPQCNKMYSIPHAQHIEVDTRCRRLHAGIEDRADSMSKFMEPSSLQVRTHLVT